MEKITVFADGGSVKVGTDLLSINIPNGLGDGTHSVIIGDYNEDQKLVVDAQFVTTMEAKEEIYVYESDYSKEKVKSLKGEIAIFRNNGDVYFLIK